MNKFLLAPVVLGLALGAAHLATAQAPAPVAAVVAAPARSGEFNIRDFGARGDGKTLDTDAINRAIDAATAAGGGTVLFPAGTYPSFSIRLKSNIRLHLAQGAVLLAAKSTANQGYDAPPDR